MFSNVLRVFAIASMACFAVLASAQLHPSYSVIGNGFSVRAISADGLTLVGTAQGRPASWNPTSGLTFLPLSADNTTGVANDVSADGSVIVGKDGSTAAVWNNHVLKNISGRTEVTAVSNDGAYFGGNTTGHLAWYFNGSSFVDSRVPKVTGISGDGHYEIGINSLYVYLWNTGLSASRSLKYAPDGDGQSKGPSITLHGDYVYGSSKYLGPYYWVEFLHKTPIATLPYYVETAVADDNSLASAETLMYFPSQRQVLSQAQFFSDMGMADLNATLSGVKVVAISGDGTVVAGTGVDVNGALVSWRAQLGLFGKSDLYKVVPNTVTSVPAPGVLGNDLYGLDAKTVLVSNAQHGTVQLANDGSFQYTPAQNFLGRDSFTYRLVKGGLSSDIITAVLKVGVPTSIAITRNAVAGGSSASATVTFNFTAFAPTAVAIKSTKPTAAIVPTSVTLPAGKNSVTFAVPTNAISTTTVASISATLSESSVTTGLTVESYSPKAITFNPSPLRGGSTGKGHVTLWKPVGAAGCTYSITSGDTKLAKVTSTVTVPAGATSFDFNILASVVTEVKTVNITASGNGGSTSAVLTLRLPTVQGLVLSETTMVSGRQSYATVTLEAPAPRTYVVRVNGYPSEILKGHQSQDVLFYAPYTASSTSVQIPAAGEDGTMVYAPLTLNAASLTGIAFVTNPVNGGSPTDFRTQFDGAPDTAQKVTFSSSNPTIVPAPAPSASGLTTSAVSTSTNVTITGTYKGVSKSAVLTVVPAVLSTMSISPTTMTVASTGTGSLTLKGLTAGAGLKISLSSSDPTVVSVPSSVTIGPNQSGGTFTVTPHAMTQMKSAVITATQGGVTRTVYVWVKP